MVRKMVMDSNQKKMDLLMMVILKMELGADLEYSKASMEVHTRDNGKPLKLKEEELLTGQMVTSMKANGKIM